MPAYYPVFVDIRSRRCVVFGGNHEAERKVRYLVECGGDVTVLAEETTPGLAAMERDGVIRRVRRGYRPGDLEGAWIAVVAHASSDETNEAIAAEARSRNVLLNVMDVTALCTFIAPSLVHHNDVTLAISTAGTSPALARRLREEIGSEKCSCMRWAEIGPILAEARTIIRARNLRVTPEEWQECLTEDLIDLHRAGRGNEARARLVAALEDKARAHPS